MAEYRDEMQARAREALGMPLFIGALEGGWSGFDPVLTAHDVQVGEGASALRLDKVRLVPDMFGSLLARQPRLANLQIEGLQLSLHQGEDGRWRGTAGDVVGEAVGEVAGNALNWRYTLKLPVDGKVYEVQFDDWMYLMDQNTLINRASMSKFGFELGEVTLFFRKRQP